MCTQNNQSAVKAVFFDLDGTITEPFLDFDLIREQMELDKGAGPILEILADSPVHQREKMKRILEYHESEAIENSALNPGVKRTLDRLKKMGIRTAILTRNTRRNALAVTEKHCIEFDSVFGRDDGPSKPDAFGVLQLAGKFGVLPEQVLVVGDYLHDLEAARAAGAHPVLITTHENYSEFLEYAEFRIDSVSNVIPIIERLNDESKNSGGENYAV